MTVARVLVIEDETVLLSAMIRGLSKLPGVEAVGAGSLEEALLLLDERQADVILSDLNLPGRSGLELLGELSVRGHCTPVAFISAYFEAFGARIPRHKNVRVLEKPVEPEELRTLVRDILGWDSVGSDFPPFGIVDYLQIAGMGGHSVVLEVVGADTIPFGRIEMVSGDLWTAEDAEGTGADAFARLVNLPAALVACRALQGEAAERNISEGWEELVFDAARVADEESGFESLLGEQPASEDVLQGPAEESEKEEPAEIDFEKALGRGLEALLAKDYSKAFDAFIDARSVRPQDKVVEASLSRLRDLGFDPDMTK